MIGNLSASILTRLLTLAKQRGDDYSLLLNRFALERLFLRVGTSPHANRFVLKGALLFTLWYDQPHRPTRDADLLGLDPEDEANLIATFARRQTLLPTERPLALTREFGENSAKLGQWKAFLNKNRITAGSLVDTVELLSQLLWPPTEVAAANSQATATWHPEFERWA